MSATARVRDFHLNWLPLKLKLNTPTPPTLSEVLGSFDEDLMSMQQYAPCMMATGSAGHSDQYLVYNSKTQESRPLNIDEKEFAYLRAIALFGAGECTD